MKKGSGFGVQGSGLRVALTQSRGRLESLQAMLEQRGYEVIRQPLIETQPLLDDKIRLEAQKLLECAWILFTSRTSVEVWQHFGFNFSNGLQPLVIPNVGAVGKKTAEQLREIGVTVSLIADSQNADNFAEMFLNHPKASSPVGLPQGDKALDTLQKKLEQHGFEVRPVVIYKTVLCSQTFQNVDVIVLASPSAVEAVIEKGDAQLVAIGETTLKAVEARGWQAVQVASPDVASILQAVERMNTATVGRVT
jgi:uroporphyrinogen-III synthase